MPWISGFTEVVKFEAFIRKLPVFLISCQLPVGKQITIDVPIPLGHLLYIAKQGEHRKDKAHF